MKRPPILLLLVLLTLAGFALRLYRLDALPFRGDEAFAAQYWAGEPLAVSLTQVATLEPHPPLTYALFRAWGVLIGIGEFTLRLLPLFFNLLGIPVVYTLGKFFGERRIGLLAAALWAVNPFEIWHAQDARNYAIWAAMSVIALWLGLRVTKYDTRGAWLLYLVGALITALTFYNELLMMAALSLYVILTRWKDHAFLARWFAAQVAVALIVAAVFLLIQGRLFAEGSYGGTVGSFSAPLWVTWFLPTLAFGETLQHGEPSLFVWLPLLMVIMLGLYAVWRLNRRFALFTIIVGGIPLLLLGLVSLKMNIFHPRYVITAAPAMMLAIGGLLVWLAKQGSTWHIRRVLPALLVILWAGASGLSLFNHYFATDYRKSQDWAALTQYLAEHVSPDDLVIQTSVDAAFGYYYDAPAEDIGLPANPQEPREDIIATLEASRDHYRSLWVVGRTFADWPNFGIVEEWVQENMQRVRSTQTAGLPIQQFMPWEVREDEVGPAPLIRFEATAALRDARILLPPEPTRELTVWLYWQPFDRTETSYKIFVHLVGATNPVSQTPLWSQDDQYPQDGRIDTRLWEIGQTYRDVYHLPLAEVPAGDYRLEVGLYDPETNTRVLTEGGKDSFIVAQLSLPD